MAGSSSVIQFNIIDRSMSNEDQWARTQIQLAKLISTEVTGPKGFESRRLANDYIRRLFIDYNEIFVKLDDFYTICLHPQKRTIVRLLLTGLVGRLIELKDELIKFDSCELTFFEDLALEQKKTLVFRRKFDRSKRKYFVFRRIFLFEFLDFLLRIV